MPSTKNFFNAPGKLAGQTMRMITGKGPTPTPLSAPSDSNSPEIQEALRKEKELAQRRTGRRATILTDAVQPVQDGKTLLGS